MVYGERSAGGGGKEGSRKLGILDKALKTNFARERSIQKEGSSTLWDS